MLKKQIVPIGKLFLDPNNPRLREKSPGAAPRVDDREVVALQGKLLKQLIGTAGMDPHGLEELMQSMKLLGFTGIDRVVVRPMENSGDFLVLEGNRRIAAAKRILEETDGGRYTLENARLETLRAIEVQVVDTEGKSQEQIDEYVNTILGIRHYGSLLEWEPLPRAHNIYKEYMRLSESKAFSLNMITAGKVADRLAIKRAKTVDALRSYIAYTQLMAAEFGVQRKHYSLIEALVTNKKLRDGYFEVDEKTLRLEEPSLERVNRLCQFSQRDTNPKNILPKPQAVAWLAKLYTMSYSDGDAATADFAKLKLREVEEGEAPLEEALEQAEGYSKRRKWVGELDGLLKKQRASLKATDFKAAGNALLLLEEVEQTMRRLRAVVSA